MSLLGPQGTNNRPLTTAFTMWWRTTVDYSGLQQRIADNDYTTSFASLQSTVCIVMTRDRIGVA